MTTSVALRRRAPRIWMFAALQFLVVEFLVAGSWRGHYSYSYHFISDLGVPFCGPQGERPCSSMAALLNGSLLVVSAAYVSIAILWRARLRPYPLAATFAVAAGIGVAIVGSVPSNTIWAVHSLGATLFFVFGSLFTLLCGTAGVRVGMRGPGVAAQVIAVVGLTGFFCFTYSWDLGLGTGGIERVVAYSALLGFVLGVYLLDRLPSAPAAENLGGTETVAGSS
ncbi:DUF998 domain-containing protein [Rhodococcus sp. O3]|uniref:DUF998 domain-containing protein n=1 Tax=Rhodococcus sp. O3 TaxID=3404919 RepID=UPI003B678696